MSRLLDLQQKYRELGRLRTGAKTIAQSGRSVPTKLSTWRLTSASKTLLEAVAVIYGGTVEVWTDAPSEGTQYELTTDADTLHVAVPYGEVLTQHWEMWSGGGCKRRCNGVEQELVARPCACPKDLEDRMEKAGLNPPQACRPHTRLSLILPDIPDVGVWRLETQSLNAAQELPAVFDILQASVARGEVLPARLRIDHRQTKVEGKPTQKFTVPVLEIEQTVHEIVERIAQRGGRELEAGAVGQFGPPVQPRSLPGGPPPLSTDVQTPAAASAPAHTTTAQEQQPAERLPGPQPSTPSELPPWLRGIDADDGTVIDEANKMLTAAGSDRFADRLADVHLLLKSEEERQELVRRVGAIIELRKAATREPLPEEPVDGTLL